MAYNGQPNNGPPPYGTDPGYCPPPPQVVENPGYCPPPPQFGGNPGYFPPHPQTIIYQTAGNCPACRQGFLSSNVTVLGVLCAIFLFPIGLVCLFLLQEQKCSHCGYTS